MISLRDVVTGFGNRDPLAEVWRRNLRGGGGGAAVITGSLPLRYIGNGTPLSDYLISGNTVQDGTPSPEAPVDVQGCGVRTENVMPAGEKKTVEVDGVTFSSDGNGRYHISGTASQDAKVHFNLVSGFTIPVSVSKGGQGTLSLFNGKEYNNVKLVFCNGSTEIDDWRLLPKNRTNTEYTRIGNKYVDSIRIAVSAGVTVDVTIMPEFTDDGILPSEFEPYGYKLPLTVNGTEHPIYLGQVPTTRRIKKLVLTGEENWGTGTTHVFNLQALPYLRNSENKPFCTHYTGTNTVDQTSRLSDGETAFLVSYSGGNRFYICDHAYTEVADFKSYLAAQYTAGTPVTVWYVLETPTTGIVNEPLHKIGDYADTISMAQAGVVFPTVSGANVLDMTSPIKPSEAYIKGKGIKPTNDPNFENGG